MNRVVHFEFAAQDPERSARFYQDVFGWSVQRWPGPETYLMAVTGPDGTPGINGGILRHKDGAARTVNTIEVQSIEEAIARIEAGGGQVVVAKMPIPGVGYLAYCTDTESMIFGICQFDPTAR